MTSYRNSHAGNIKTHSSKVEELVVPTCNRASNLFISGFSIGSVSSSECVAW
jgi:hypothetical protein